MEASKRPNGSTSFGTLLRRWRQIRGKSQLVLATEAEVSNRHLSFLETGRAQPSREMIQLLGRALDLPLGERNALLLAAGYAPAYGARDLDAKELEPVRRAMEFILRQQEPYPAIVVDAGWRIVMHNRAAQSIFGAFRSVPEIAENAMRNVFHPRGLRRFIVNWEEFAGALIQKLHREAAQGANAAASCLLDEVLAYPDVSERWKNPDPRIAVPPLLTMRLEKQELCLAFFSTITVLSTPQDITLQQLRIECFHPCDSATEEAAHRLAGATVST